MVQIQIQIEHINDRLKFSSVNLATPDATPKEVELVADVEALISAILEDVLSGDFQERMAEENE